jgi:hypothetical protein
VGGETISSNGEPGTKEAEAFVDAPNHSAERVQTLGSASSPSCSI